MLGSTRKKIAIVSAIIMRGEAEFSWDPSGWIIKERALHVKVFLVDERIKKAFHFLPPLHKNLFILRFPRVQVSIIYLYTYYVYTGYNM